MKIIIEKGETITMTAEELNSLSDDDEVVVEGYLKIQDPNNIGAIFFASGRLYQISYTDEL